MIGDAWPGKSWEHRPQNRTKRDRSHGRQRNKQVQEAREAQIREDNELYLHKFEGYMRKKEMAESSIQRHMQNARFYLMEALVQEDNHTMKDGASAAVPFLKYWYPQRWGAKTRDRTLMKQSLKRFYRCMYELDYIQDPLYNSFLAEIGKLDF